VDTPDRTNALGHVAPAALHEISSGVAGLAGLVELLALDAEPGSEQAGHFELALRSADALRRLLRSLAALTQADAELIARVETLAEAGPLSVRMDGDRVLLVAPGHEPLALP
jgi:hypothetical protein